MPEYRCATCSDVIGVDALCAHSQANPGHVAFERVEAPQAPGGLPTAPPGDISTDQGAVRPDVPTFSWTQRRRR